MTTYVYRDGVLVEKHKAPPKSGVSVMSDIKPFTTQDGHEITSRSGLRAYEQKHGVKQIGNDCASEISSIKERRMNFLEGR